MDVSSLPPVPSVAILAYQVKVRRLSEHTGVRRSRAVGCGWPGGKGYSGIEARMWSGGYTARLGLRLGC